jgi:hypothetical protein
MLSATSMRGALRLVLAGALLLPGPGCNGEASQGSGSGSPGPRETIPSPPPPTPTAGGDRSDEDAGERRTRLMAWLDPDAIAVGYSRVTEHLRGDAVAVVYALPPRAEDLLQAITDVDEALEAIRPTDAPKADTWLGHEALVTAGRMSRRPMVLRPLLVPKAEAAARLQALGLEPQEVDAFEVWMPRRVLPYRVVLLDGDVIGFIPASEPGTGVAPLAAARDMPPSEVETQLEALLAGAEAPAVALFVAGPMLHLDLDEDVLTVRFELRKAAAGGFDGAIALQLPGEDSKPAVAALEGRKAPEQSDAIQQLVERAAFAANGPIVEGRLQLSATDAALLEVEP